MIISRDVRKVMLLLERVEESLASIALSLERKQ